MENIIKEIQEFEQKLIDLPVHPNILNLELGQLFKKFIENSGIKVEERDYCEYMLTWLSPMDENSDIVYSYRGCVEDLDDFIDEWSNYTLEKLFKDKITILRNFRELNKQLDIISNEVLRFTVHNWADYKDRYFKYLKKNKGDK